jgi:hypothetical protein
MIRKNAESITLYLFPRCIWSVIGFDEYTKLAKIIYTLRKESYSHQRLDVVYCPIGQGLVLMTDLVTRVRYCAAS